MGLRYRVPLPGPFYYSGRVGLERRVPRSSSTGSGIFYFVMKWLVVYPVLFSSVSARLSCSPRVFLFSGLSQLRRISLPLAFLGVDPDGAPTLGWHRVRRLVIARGGGHGRVRPIIHPPFAVFWGDGPTQLDPTHCSVADVSPSWVDGLPSEP